MLPCCGMMQGCLGCCRLLWPQNLSHVFFALRFLLQICRTWVRTYGDFALSPSSRNKIFKPTEHTTPDRWCPLTVRFDVRVQEEYVTAPDSTLGTSVTWYMDVSEYLRVSLAIALGGHVLDKCAVVWYAAVGFVDNDRNAARVLARRAQVVTRRITT